MWLVSQRTARRRVSTMPQLQLTGLLAGNNRRRYMSLLEPYCPQNCFNALPGNALRPMSIVLTKNVRSVLNLNWIFSLSKCLLRPNEKFLGTVVRWDNTTHRLFKLLLDYYLKDHCLDNLSNGDWPLGTEKYTVVKIGNMSTCISSGRAVSGVRVENCGGYVYLDIGTLDMTNKTKT
ncbi:hypothetical protein C8Q75DRAFT_869926 [Abortiporus biennis]|nr:hypothetical protein C8Q75DRAFT_869926 [Abortiporus biennis]